MVYNDIEHSLPSFLFFLYFCLNMIF
jgi:hypothetical protein